MFFKQKKRKTGSRSNIQPNYLPKQRENRISRSSRKKQKLFLKKVNKPSKLPKIKKLFLYTLILSVVGFAVYFLFFSGIFQIKNIEVKYIGEELDENIAIIQSELEPYMQTNIFKADRYEIAEQLYGSHLDISELKIKKTLPDTIEVKFNRYPIIVNIINIVGDVEEKFLVNKAGMIVQKDNDNPNLPYIRAFTNESFTTNTIIIDEVKLEYILKAIQLFEDRFGMKVFEAKFYPIEREVHLRTEKYFDIWIDMTKDLERQLKKLKNAYPELDIYNTPLEYVDLRIFSATGDRIDYKPLN